MSSEMPVSWLQNGRLNILPVSCGQLNQIGEQLGIRYRAGVDQSQVAIEN